MKYGLDRNKTGVNEREKRINKNLRNYKPFEFLWVPIQELGTIMQFLDYLNDSKQWRKNDYIRKNYIWRKKISLHQDIEPSHLLWKRNCKSIKKKWNVIMKENKIYENG